MRMILLAVCVFPALAAHAQGLSTAAQAGGLQAQLEAAQAQGTAAAARPGDEKLTCDEMQTEIVAVAQSPEFQAGLALFGNPAQRDPGQIDDAQQHLDPQTFASGTRNFWSLAQGLAMAALPNSVGAAAQQAVGMVQGAQLQAQAGQFQQQMISQAPQLAAMMGPAMRGQRVMELAEARKCEWLKGDPLSTPESTQVLPELPAAPEER